MWCGGHPSPRSNTRVWLGTRVSGWLGGRESLQTVPLCLANRHEEEIRQASRGEKDNPKAEHGDDVPIIPALGNSPSKWFLFELEFDKSRRKVKRLRRGMSMDILALDTDTGWQWDPWAFLPTPVTQCSWWSLPLRCMAQ